MKNSRFLIGLGVAFLIGVQPFFAQSKSERAAKEKQAVSEILKSQQYTIEVDRVIPLSGRSRHLTTDYSLEIKGDSVISYLPYFGQAYSVPYGGGKGLIFEAPLTDYKLSFNRKDKAHIRFKSRTDEDTFTFSIEIFPNGSATINVTPVNRQSISYYGELVHERD